MTEKALKPIKPFLNYEEQIKNLIERKGMVITDRKFATSKLEDISYFALIDGYKNLFYNPMTRKYREGTTFEDIVALYEFDEKLRALIFQYLCHFEQKMRSLISYHFWILIQRGKRIIWMQHIMIIQEQPKRKLLV
jgi:abortive infection bacteriophage resistance protein